MVFTSLTMGKMRLTNSFSNIFDKIRRKLISQYEEGQLSKLLNKV